MSDVISLAKKDDTSHPVSLVLPMDLKEEKLDKFEEEVFEQLRVNLVQYLMKENSTKLKNLPNQSYLLWTIVGRST